MELTIQRRDQAVARLQLHGVAGAGGAGFPTYLKYRQATPVLVVNVQDSEPGYVKDKLILLSQADELRDAVGLLRDTFGFERVVFALKQSYRDWFAPLAGGFELSFTTDDYWNGEAKHLVGQVLGVAVPTDARTQDHGATVSCLETVLNIWRSLRCDQPVTDKFVQVYGDVDRPRLYRVPVGTPALDLLWRSRLDLNRTRAPIVLAGGPMMGEEVSVDAFSIGKTTGDLFVTDQDFFERRNATTPTWHHSPSQIAALLGIEHCTHWHPDPSEIVDLRGEIERVRLDLVQTRRFGGPSRPVVEVGEHVTTGQLIAEPHPRLGGLGLHASIDGDVEAVGEHRIVVRRRRGALSRVRRPTGPIGDVEAADAVLAADADIEGEWIRCLARADLDRLAAARQGAQVPPDVESALRQALDEVANGRLPVRLRPDRFAPAATLERNLRAAVADRALVLLGWQPGRFGPARPTHHGYLLTYAAPGDGQALIQAGTVALAAVTRSAAAPPGKGLDETVRAAWLAAADQLAGAATPADLGPALALWCDATQTAIAAATAGDTPRAAALRAHLNSALATARQLGASAPALRCLLEAAGLLGQWLASEVAS